MCNCECVFFFIQMQNRFEWSNGKCEVFQWFRQQHLRRYTYVCDVHCMHSVHICCSVLYECECVRVFLVFSVRMFSHSLWAHSHAWASAQSYSTQQHSLNSNAFKRIIFRAIQVSVCYRFSFASLFLLIRISFAWLYIVPPPPPPPSTANRCSCSCSHCTRCGGRILLTITWTVGLDIFNQFDFFKRQRDNNTSIK